MSGSQISKWCQNIHVTMVGRRNHGIHAVNNMNEGYWTSTPGNKCSSFDAFHRDRKCWAVVRISANSGEVNHREIPDNVAEIFSQRKLELRNQYGQNDLYQSTSSADMRQSASLKTHSFRAEKI